MDENHCPPYRPATTSTPPSRAVQPDLPQDGNSYNPRPGTANSARSPTLSANSNIWTPGNKVDATPGVPYPPIPSESSSAWMTDSTAYTSPPPSAPMSAPPSLLTSEPLSRSSVSPSLPSSSTFPQQLPLRSTPTKIKRKRDRSSSLPVIPTIPKRQKIQATSVPSVLQNPHTSTIPTRIPNQTLIASRTPPINPTSLRSLDASEILKSPQLRHDLLFDALAFRPVYPSASPPTDIAGKTNHIISEMYWESVGVELTTGCRCTRWVVMGEGKIVEGQRNLAGKKRVEGCVCGGWNMNLTEGDWWKYQSGRWASRLPDLINTLREILLSLMGSTTPCADHFAHSFSREALEAHERTCPTITHALVPELYQALDPQFLSAQIRRGVLGVGLFQMLGEAMKVHCAPVRDAMVDDMVATALKGEVTMGLKRCFDCVEVMKLDIANHQVHALRPFLWTNAIPHEVNAFHQTLYTSKVSLLSSQTQKFMRNASLAVLSSTPPAQRARLSTVLRPELVARSLVKGFMNLVTSQWVVDSAWPPIPQKRINGSAGAQLAEIPIPGSITLPETLRMDGRRIKNFNAEYTELGIVHCVLVALRGLVRRKDDWETGRIMGEMKGDLKDHIGRFGKLRMDVEGDVSDLGIRLAGRIVKPKNGGSEEGVKMYSKVEVGELRRVAIKVDGILRSATSVNGARRGMADVREGLERVLGDLLVGDRPRKSGNRARVEDDEMDVDDDTPAAYTSNHQAESQDKMFRRLGMFTGDQGSEDGGIVPELKDLAKKMERIAGFNLKCFGEIYGMKGMVAGK